MTNLENSSEYKKGSPLINLHFATIIWQKFFKSTENQTAQEQNGSLSVSMLDPAHVSLLYFYLPLCNTFVTLDRVVYSPDR